VSDGERARKVGSYVGVVGGLLVGRARVVGMGKKIPESTSSSCSCSVMVARRPASSSSAWFKGYQPRSAIAFLFDTGLAKDLDHA